MKIVVFFIIVNIMGFCPIYAHQDFYTIKDYGNVKVRVQTGYNYEEINRALIIGQLAEELTKELEYKRPFFLDFIHNYMTDNEKASYFISFDNGTFLDNGILLNEKLFENNVLVIR